MQTVILVVLCIVIVALLASHIDLLIRVGNIEKVTDLLHAIGKLQQGLICSLLAKQKQATDAADETEPEETINDNEEADGPSTV